MTPSLAFERAPAFAAPVRGTHLRLVFLYVCAALVYLPVPGMEGSAGPMLLASALLLHILFSPLEYVVGAVAFGFLAAACAKLSTLFHTLRWGCLAVALVVVTLRFIFRTRGRIRGSFGRFDYLTVVFVIIAFISALNSVARNLSLVKLGAMVCLLYLLAQSARSLVEQYGPWASRRLALALLAVTAPLIVLPVVSSALSFGPPTEYAGWFSGYFANPNAWASLLMLALPWMFPPLLRAGPWHAGHWWLAGGVLATIAYLVRSGSRAGLLAAAVAGTVICVIHLNRRIAACVTLAAVIFAAQSLADPDFVPAVIQRYVVKHGRREILQSRRRPWQVAQRHFAERPWLGLGFGVTSESQVSWSMDVQTGATMVETGSSVWSALSQVGGAGAAVLFLAILGLLAHGGWFAWRVRDPWLTAVFASVCALTVNSLFEGWLLAPGNYAVTYYWFQCFCLSALMSCYRPRRRETVRT